MTQRDAFEGAAV